MKLDDFTKNLIIDIKKELWEQFYFNESLVLTKIDWQTPSQYIYISIWSLVDIINYIKKIIYINNYLKNWIKNIIYIIKYNKNIKELGFNANLIYKNWTIKKIEIYFRFL